MGRIDEVTVFETVNPIELGMVRNLLETAGIPHVVHGGSASSLLGAHMGAAFGGLQRVAVRKADEERAFDLLDQALGEGADPESETP